MRLTLDEFSKHFKMSKEMINSKLRSKKLNYIIENGVTYIIVTRSSLDSEKRSVIHTEKKETVQQEKMQEKMQTQTQTPVKAKTTVAMVLGLYQRENQQLKDKILQLEAKIDKLIDDKEQMLRDEMNKIEQVYNTKDMQLKNILELVNAKFKAQTLQMVHEVESIESQTEAKSAEEIVELKSYLKTLDLESHERKTIKKRFEAAYNDDIRIIKQNGSIFLNFSKYDYSDLLKY